MLASIDRHGLFLPGERVLVAVSGGADSLALLHLLHDLADHLSLALMVAHLDHGLRGEASAAEARAVAEQAARLGLPCVTERVRLAELAAARKISLETAGREARYAFFERAARETGCARVATGHTADDRVETLLLNLLRGTGLDGLRGVPRSRPLGDAGIQVVRPLLDLRRHETIAFCRERGLRPCEDPTNRLLDFARNRVRHRLLPVLEAEAPKGLRARLLALAEIAAEEVELLERMAEETLRTVLLEERSGALSLATAKLSAAPAALARRVLRRAVRRVDRGADLDRASTELLLRLTGGDLATGITLPGGRVRAVRRGDTLRLERIETTKAPPVEAVSEPIPLPVPGAAVIAGRRITATFVEPPAQPAGDPARWVLIDADKLQGGLQVRLPRPGDRIQPLGMQGHRKLQDLFVDAQLPRDARARVPVVTDAGKLVWVVGFCISETVRLDASTRRVVRLEVQAADGDSV